MRRKRRKRFWIAAIVTLVAVILLAAVTLRSETRDLVGFFDTSRRVSEAQAVRAEVFQELLREDLGAVDRESFMNIVGQLQEGMDEAEAELVATDPPPAALGAYTTLQLAISSWSDGLGQFEPALLGVVDEPQSRRAELALEESLTALRLGDAAYIEFMLLTDDLRAGLDVEISEFPTVAYVTGDPPFLASELAVQARSSRGLQLFVDIAISAVRLDPEEIADPESNVAIVPATETIDVQVVVANNGNRTELDVRVTATLSTDGGDLLNQEQVVLEEMAPGQQQTATFLGLAVQPSEAYDLVVRLVPAPGEQEPELENNLNQRRFLVNEPSNPG